MANQVDPRYFDIGGAFTQGVQQAQEGKRRNALLDMQQQQYGQDNQRFQWQGQDRARMEQERAASSQQSQQQQQIWAKLFQDNGLPPELAFTDGADELAAELLKQKVAPKPEAKPPQSFAEWELAQQNPGYADHLRQQNAPKPTETKPQLVEVTMPDGSIQKQWLQPGQAEGTPVGSPAFNRQTQLSPKDLVTARNKVNTVKLARQQLADIKKAFEPLKGSLSAGAFGQGKVPSPSGNSFDRAVDRMRSTLTSLTRVPGVGAMSDYETRLDQAKFPNRGDYEETTQQSIDALDAMLNAVETGYTDLISQGPVQPQEQGKRLSPDEASKLPPGTKFIGMDGVERTKN